MLQETLVQVEHLVLRDHLGQKGQEGKGLCGVKYVRWGRTSCGEDAQVVYTGKCFISKLFKVQSGARDEDSKTRSQSSRSRVRNTAFLKAVAKSAVVLAKVELHFILILLGSNITQKTSCRRRHVDLQTCVTEEFKTKEN